MKQSSLRALFGAKKGPSSAAGTPADEDVGKGCVVSNAPAARPAPAPEAESSKLSQLSEQTPARAPEDAGAPEEDPIAEQAAAGTQSPAAGAAQAIGQTTERPAVGQRLSVFWKDDDAWYEGIVQAYSGTAAHVVYDDGEEEDLDLDSEQFRLLPARAAATAGKRRRAARTVVSVPQGLEDSDVEMSGSSDGGASDDDFDGGGGDPSSESAAESLDEGPSDAEAGAAAAAASDGDEDGAPAKKRPRASGKGKARSEASPSENAGGSYGQQAERVPPAAPPVARPGELRSRLVGSGGSPDESPGGCALDSARFAGRYATPKFAFMTPEKFRDAERRRPDDADYDASTCALPPDWFKAHKVSDGQRQWWEFKAANWDSILLFKMGKFYELFEMDAMAGVDLLGLQFMKGDQPHAGFPEAAYETMAERLARAGRRVVVVEQTETPEMLKAFNDAAPKGGKRKVVRREAVAVLSQGTLVDAGMLAAHPHAAYIAAVAEGPPRDGNAGGAAVGVCAVEVAEGRVLLGQFEDGPLRSTLQRCLTELRVTEAVVPKGSRSVLDPGTRAMMKGLLPDARFSLLPAKHWSAAPVRAAGFADSFGSSAVPFVLQEHIDGGEGSAAAVSAFAAMLAFLQRSLLDRAVLSVGVVERLLPRAAADGAVQGSDPAGTSAAGCSADAQVDAATLPTDPAAPLLLDGPALSNLEVIDSDAAGGSVFAQLDHCVTPGGKRLLRAWLARPLQSVAAIAARQDAVAELMDALLDTAEDASGHLAKLGDLERATVRLAAGAAGALGRDAPHVILYEDTAKRKVRAMTGVLWGLQESQAAVEALLAAGPRAAALAGLLEWGSERMPDFRTPLRELLDAADWQQAERDGRVTPNAGVDGPFDAAVQSVREADDALKEYLDEFCELLGQPRGTPDVKYVSVHKDSHVLEVPERLAKKVPSDFHAMAAKKGVKRFSSSALAALVAARAAALEGVEQAQLSILQRLTGRFAERKAMWLQVAAALAELDALMSLARAAITGSAHGPMCRPTVTLEHPVDNFERPFFQAHALRHATTIRLSQAASFVPNDVDIGVHEPPFMLLTGPNTGGKSTLMRQVCLATLLAQTGAWLPAASVTLSPADAIFVRMGAKDHIMLGQSTFFVELAETAAMLASATPRSIVALDELGRGTATMDGVAIAGAVLTHVADHIRCRGVFATHYHVLADEFAGSERVAVKHMACDVDAAGPGGVPKVVCKYLLTPGACPKSYGPTVARAAGIPERIAARAIEISDEFEASHKGGRAFGAHVSGQGIAEAEPGSEEEAFCAVWAQLAGDDSGKGVRSAVQFAASACQ